jgi:hypothetical protein
MFEKFDKIRRISEELDLVDQTAQRELRKRFPGEDPDLISAGHYLTWLAEGSQAAQSQTATRDRLRGALVEYSKSDIDELIGIIYFGRDCEPSGATDILKEFAVYRKLSCLAHSDGDILYLATKPLGKYIARAERLLSGIDPEGEQCA